MASGTAVRPGGVQQREVRPSGQVRIGPRTLDQGADPGQHRTPGGGDRLAQHLDLAGRRQHQAEQHPHRRGLPRTVGAEEPVDVALVDLEVDGVDSAQLAVPLGQRAGADHGGVGHCCASNSAAARCERLGGHRAGQQERATAIPARRHQQPDRADRRERADTGQARRRAGLQPFPQRAGDPAAQRQRDQSGRPAPIDPDRARVLPRAGSEAGEGGRQVERRVRVGRRRDIDRFLVDHLSARIGHEPGGRGVGQPEAELQQGRGQHRALILRPVQLHAQRQPGLRICPQIDMGDGRGGLGRDESYTRRVEAREPTSGQPGQLLGAYALEHGLGEGGRQQVRRIGQPDLRNGGDRRPLRLEHPANRGLPVPEQIGFPRCADPVDAPVVGAAPPDPQLVVLAEQLGQVDERVVVGHLKRAPGLHISGPRDAP